MTTILNKYKDRSPEETISIIQQFFSNLGLQVVEEAVQNSECGSWGCLLKVFIDDKCILAQNGKGTSKIFAIASGYAELFERFCTKNTIYGNPIVSNILLEVHKTKKGYYLHPNERISSISDFKNHSPVLYELYMKYCGNEENFKLLLDYYYGGKIIETPMINCFDSADVIYEDSRLWMKQFNSGGLSAGNTLEEALVQGMSEIFERYACEQFFKDTEVGLYEVSQSYLKTLPNIASMLTSLPKHKTIKIFDLSYNYNVPACLGVMINNQYLTFSLDFSSAPTFEIAAERAITELYQMRTPRADYLLNTRSIPQNYNWTFHLGDSLSHVPRAEYYPIKHFLNAVEVDHFNPELFLPSEQYSNSQLLAHYKKVSEMQGFGMYYQNVSPIPDMFAVQIITHDRPFLTFHSEFFGSNECSTLQKTNIIKKLSSFLQDFIQALEANDVNLSSKLKSHLLNDIEDTVASSFFAGHIRGTSWFWPWPSRQEFSFVRKAATTPININTLYDTYDDFYRDKAKKYIMLFDFKSKGVYNDEEIKQIFKTFNINISQEELNNILDVDYFFHKTVITTLKDLYTSSSFKKMLEAYCEIF